jgi:hypothetical protein
MLKAEPEQILVLVNEGIVPAPRYRYKDKDYYSSFDMDRLMDWLYFQHCGLDYAALLRLRERLEEDVNRYFLTPDRGGMFLAAPEHYEFQHQVVFPGKCLSDLHSELLERENTLQGYTKAETIKLIEEYLDGFVHLFPGDSGWSMGLRSAYLKETPIRRLSPRRLRKGLEQGRFSKAQLEDLTRTRQEELWELQELLEDLDDKDDRGGKDGKQDA